jgi:hypothetical protein
MSNSSAWVAFWREYRAGGLTERPSLFPKEDHPGLGVSIESVFGATVRMCDQFRDLPRSGRILFQNIRFYINGQRIEDPSEYLMRRNDGDFAGWHNRLDHVASDYCIVFNRLEGTFGDDIDGVYELLRPLVRELGLPARKSEVTLFAGRYKKTPFGIHNDDELNFFWPLIGPKRVRFWNPDYGNSNPGLARLLDYDEHLSDSFVLDAQAGDMLAWPGSWWHVAEGAGQFSVSLTIPLEWYSSREKLDHAQLVEKLSKLLLRVAAAHSDSTLIPGRVKEDTSETIPDAISDAARLFSRISSEDISDALTEQWLRKMTTAGLRIARAVRSDVVIDESQVIRGADGGGIRWAKLSRGKMCIASGGHSVLLPESPAVIEIIGQLNTTKPMPVHTLIELVASRCNDRSPSAVTKFVLTMLAKIGAVEPAAGVDQPDLAARKM